jgi:Phage portal protein, lambda family
VSRFAPAIVKLFTLDLYDDAELERKKTAAMFAMFITSPAPETPLDPADEDLEVEPGQVVRLDPGEDVTTPATPDSGATYEPFQYRTLLQISAALGIPYGYLTNDTAKGNFSNGRGLMPFAPLQARMRREVGGDLSLRWLRCDRSLSADSWVLTDVPMSEASETYDLEILNGAGVEVVQQAIADTQSALQPLIPYLDTLRWLFIATALIGVRFTIYARWDDWRKGRR